MVARSSATCAFMGERRQGACAMSARLKRYEVERQFIGAVNTLVSTPHPLEGLTGAAVEFWLSRNAIKSQQVVSAVTSLTKLMDSVFYESGQEVLERVEHLEASV